MSGRNKGFVLLRDVLLCGSRKGLLCCVGVWWVGLRVWEERCVRDGWMDGGL